MINMTMPLFEEEIMADLLTNDQDAVAACLIATTRPDIQTMQYNVLLLAKRHSDYHRAGLSDTPGHDIICGYISVLDEQIGRALGGMWN